MKFLLIAGFSGSIINFRGPLLEELVAAGIEVHVASPGLEDGSTIRNELESMGIKAHNVKLQRTGLSPSNDVRAIVDLWRLIRLVAPDFMLSYTIKPVIYGTLVGWLANVSRRSALITGLGYSFQNSNGDHGRALLREIVERLYKFALRRAHLVLFQNPDDEALFRNLKLFPGNIRSVVVNGSGISVDDFTVAPLPAEPSFLLIARLLGDKGVREYIEAAKRVKERYPATTFRLVGWIDENPDAIQAEELDSWVSTGVVEYLGKLEDVRPAIKDCNVFVLPSYREGTPRTVLEAMAMGRAIITTDAPGCRETVVDGDNGFLVPVKSIGGLVSAMERLIADPDLVKRMGQRSREIALEKYDVHKVNAVMLKEMGIV